MCVIVRQRGVRVFCASYFMSLLHMCWTRACCAGCCVGMSCLQHIFCGRRFISLKTKAMTADVCMCFFVSCVYAFVLCVCVFVAIVVVECVVLCPRLCVCSFAPCVSCVL